MRQLMLVGARALALSALLIAGVTGNAWQGGGLEVPQDSREFFVDEAKLPFDAIPGLATERTWGVLEGAGYRIEVPENWNGDLVMYTHGFRGDGAELTVDSPPLRAWLIANGYAWAASSYDKNFYDVRSGVVSTNALARFFKYEYGKPERTFITGFSMGGHVIGAAIEMFPNFACPEGRPGRTCRRISNLLGKFSGGVKYDGAVPMCGVMGDEALFNYFGDFGLAAEALSGVESVFPPPEDYAETVRPILIGTLFSDFGAGFPNSLTPAGERLKDLTEQLSGGERPVFDIAYPGFQGLLFSFTGGTSDLDGVLPGNIYDNKRRTYQFDSDRALSEEEQALNDSILRLRKDRFANPDIPVFLERLPIISGRLTIPVVSVHTLGDLFVPFSMQQVYAKEARKRGRDHFLVSRATRAVGHCEFSPEELIESFEDMVSWVDTGVRPAGDPILKRRKVAQDDFGCQFSRGTTGSRPFIPACPAGEE